MVIQGVHSVSWSYLGGVVLVGRGGCVGGPLVVPLAR